MQNIPAVANNKPSITTAEFVNLTIYNQYSPTDANALVIGQTYEIKNSGNTPWTSLGSSSNAIGTIFTANANIANTTGTASNVEFLTFSSAYQPETINGNVYTPFGGLLAVGPQSRNLRVTEGDTTIAISGIDGNNMFEILESQGKIRGSKLQIIRGFYNNTMVLTSNSVRFTGIVTTYGIDEDRQQQEDNFTINIGASSYKTILQNRIAGRKTNKESWQFFDSTDSIMNNVNSLAGYSFDFGFDPKTKTTTAGYMPGGGGMPGGPGNFPPGWSPGQRGFDQD